MDSFSQQLMMYAHDPYRKDFQQYFSLNNASANLKAYGVRTSTSQVQELFTGSGKYVKFSKLGDNLYAVDGLSKVVVYSRSENDFVKVTDLFPAGGLGSVVRRYAVSPNNQYIHISSTVTDQGNSTLYNLFYYKNGNVFTSFGAQGSSVGANYDQGVGNSMFSQNGQYLITMSAITGANPGSIMIYQLQGTGSNPTLTASSTADMAPYTTLDSAAWGLNDYCAISSKNSTTGNYELVIFKNTGPGLSVAKLVTLVSSSTERQLDMKFSADGIYLFCRSNAFSNRAGKTATNMRVYKRSADTFTEITSSQSGSFLISQAFDISPDGTKFINYSSSSGMGIGVTVYNKSGDDWFNSVSLNSSTVLTDAEWLTYYPSATYGAT